MHSLLHEPCFLPKLSMDVCSEDCHPACPTSSRKGIRVLITDQSEIFPAFSLVNLGCSSQSLPRYLFAVILKFYLAVGRGAELVTRTQSLLSSQPYLTQASWSGVSLAGEVAVVAPAAVSLCWPWQRQQTFLSLTFLIRKRGVIALPCITELLGELVDWKKLPQARAQPVFSVRSRIAHFRFGRP